MNDRARAVQILEQARDILLNRLTERVLEAEEEILDDARGHTYAGEIDSLHDQLGMRINHVNAILAAIPRPEEGPPANIVGGAAFEPEQATSVIAGYLPVPTADSRATVIETAPEPACALQCFVDRVATDDLDAAARALAALLDTSESRARACVETFHSRLLAEPTFIDKAVELRRHVEGGSVNAALALLRECFDLRGEESLAALRSLRARAARGH